MQGCCLWCAHARSPPPHATPAGWAAVVAVPQLAAVPHSAAAPRLHTLLPMHPPNRLQVSVRLAGDMLAALTEALPRVVANGISQLRPYLGCSKAHCLRGALLASTGAVLAQVRAQRRPAHLHYMRAGWLAAHAPGWPCARGACIEMP